MKKLIILLIILLLTSCTESPTRSSLQTHFIEPTLEDVGMVQETTKPVVDCIYIDTIYSDDTTDRIDTLSIVDYVNREIAFAELQIDTVYVIDTLIIYL